MLMPQGGLEGGSHQPLLCRFQSLIPQRFRVLSRPLRESRLSLSLSLSLAMSIYETVLLGWRYVEAAPAGIIKWVSNRLPYPTYRSPLGSH